MSLSLPQIAHKGIPVVLTDTLAQVYEVKPHQIRKNFSANKDRFIEGKHFFTLSGNDLKEFKNCITKSYSVAIPSRTANLTLWTERGAARHARDGGFSFALRRCAAFPNPCDIARKRRADDGRDQRKIFCTTPAA